MKKVRNQSHFKGPLLVSYSIPLDIILSSSCYLNLCIRKSVKIGLPDS